MDLFEVPVGSSDFHCMQDQVFARACLYSSFQEHEKKDRPVNKDPEPGLSPAILRAAQLPDIPVHGAYRGS
jgi:hypothetical protein